MQLQWNFVPRQVGLLKDGAKWRVEITADSEYKCVCPPPPTPPPSVTPQPTTVCGDCDVCLQISKGKCKRGKNHDTQEECQNKGDNYEWCGASAAPTITPQPTTVCGDCEVCLNSKGICKTSGKFNTKTKCDNKGDNYVWCGAS